MNTQNKVTIIGAGFVGSTIAYSLLAANLPEEIALIDINKELVTAQVMDLQHALPFLGYSRVKVGDYNDIKDSDVAIIACGANQKPGESRLSLVKKNAAILKKILPKIFRANAKITLVIVTNPVDILTDLAIQMYPKKANQIMGTGTLLDSARFRWLLGQYLNVNPRSVHAYIAGEHGDSEFPIWSTATIGNTPVDKYHKIPAIDKKKIFQSARNAAYAIIAGKQATYYAIGAGTTALIKAILFDEHTVLPLSHRLQGEYGIKNICLSMPRVVGCEGIINTVTPILNNQEKQQLQKSAKLLQKVIASIK
ncbi:MAG: L-lactate dehydrogenase [Candidatus Komeilibacteria bacterium]